MNQTKQNKPSVNTPFSWRNQRNAVLFSLFGAGLCYFFAYYIYTWLLHMGRFLSPMGCWFLILVAVMGSFILYDQIWFLISRKEMMRYISAWKEILQQNLKQKEDAEKRIEIVQAMKREDANYFNDNYTRDHKIINTYCLTWKKDKQELDMFIYVMRERNIIARIFAMLQSYHHWNCLGPIPAT